MRYQQPEIVVDLDAYIDGLERAVQQVPKLLKEWDSVPRGLQDDFSRSLHWLLDPVNLDRMREKAMKDLRWNQEISRRCWNALHLLRAVEDKLQKTMGCTVPTAF